jgi:hypothetical protein
MILDNFLEVPKEAASAKLRRANISKCKSNIEFNSRKQHFEEQLIATLDEY